MFCLYERLFYLFFLPKKKAMNLLSAIYSDLFCFLKFTTFADNFCVNLPSRSAIMIPLFIYFCILINAESKSNQFKPFTTLQIRKYPSFPGSTTVQGLHESGYNLPRKQLSSEKVIKLNSKDNYTCIK